MINFLKKTTNVAVNSTKITLKLLIVFVLILILLIPQKMIGDLIREREGRQISAANRVAAKIGGNIDIEGPVLCVPYIEKNVVTKVDPKTKKNVQEITKIKRYAFFTADQLDIESSSIVENKKKNIYKVPYFESKNVLHASFSKADFSKWDDINETDIIYNEAMVLIGISDLKSVLTSPTAIIGDQQLQFEPGHNGTGLFHKGVYVNLPSDFAKKGGLLNVEMELRGTQALHFASIAQNNELKMESNWPHPDFEALNLIHTSTNSPRVYNQNKPIYARENTLPLNSEVSDQSGFIANWKENQFSIDQPSKWLSIETEPNLKGRMMGASFINLADHYKKTDRSVKYMALIIALVFVSFFIIELLRENKVHPFQYILVGSAVAIFFLLLLAISEYSGFNLAYLIASVATTSLIGLYSLSVFKSKSMAMSITILLALIFTFLFVLLIAVQYSLLLGAVGLFVILAMIMFATRNVKWYGLGEPNSHLNVDVERV